MANKFAELEKKLKGGATSHWLVSGVAGFIGSHLLEKLLFLGQRVTGLDNFSTGFEKNLQAVRARVGETNFARFTFIHGDICDAASVKKAVSSVDFVLHQAALGSVPRSIEDPLATNEANVVGFLSLARAAASAGVKRFVYASSSSVYGTSPARVKSEAELGKPLSPYAASKRSDEVYGDAFSAAYGLSCVGLRYFNVFGARQNPEGPYAAVIPRWLDAMRRGEAGRIFGDGKTTRDFCYVDNVVQANLLAALAEGDLSGEVFNVAVGETTSLTELYAALSASMTSKGIVQKVLPPIFEEFRKGDVRDSLADISKAKRLLGYEPTHRLATGIEALVEQEFGPAGSI